MGELAEHFAVLGVQAFDETGVVQAGLAVQFVQIAKLVQALHDRLAAWRRQLLPARKQRLPNFPLLVGSHLLPHSLTLAKFLLLRGIQFIPGLETLADSLLLVRRQISEALVVLEKFFLPVRRHVLEALEHLGWQAVHVPTPVDIRARHYVRAVRRLWARPAGRLCLAYLAELLPEGGRTEQSRCQEGGQNSPELETQFHSLVSFVTSPAAVSFGEAGNSESASNLERT